MAIGMSLRAKLPAAVIVALAIGASACDTQIQQTPDTPTPRADNKAAKSGETGDASAGPSKPGGQTPRADDPSTRGEKIDEAHRTSPENNPKEETSKADK